jgi:16S rRNA G966 N2-methylase RsmD
LFSVLNSVRKSGVREPISVYSLGRGEYEIYGGHHRAIAALLAGKLVPAVIRSLDPMSRVEPKHLASVERAYKAVESKEKLAKGRSYNPMPGRKPIRPSPNRLRMMYRAIIDTPGQTLLDAGCNDGYFGVALADHAFQPTFVDRSKAYCKVVDAKLRALGKSNDCVHCTTIQKAPAFRYDVVLYTDVFYHAAIKQSLDVAMVDWHKLMDATKRRMIFGPGRWDKLGQVGFTERMMWTHARRGGFRIRYIGRDMDPGYERPMFCLERT